MHINMHYTPSTTLLTHTTQSWQNGTRCVVLFSNEKLTWAPEVGITIKCEQGILASYVVLCEWLYCCQILVNHLNLKRSTAKQHVKTTLSRPCWETFQLCWRQFDGCLLGPLELLGRACLAAAFCIDSVLAYPFIWRAKFFPAFTALAVKLPPFTVTLIMRCGLVSCFMHTLLFFTTTHVS